MYSQLRLHTITTIIPSYAPQPPKHTKFNHLTYEASWNLITEWHTVFVTKLMSVWTTTQDWKHSACTAGMEHNFNWDTVF